jgi:two-component system response regulator RegA
VSPRGPGISEAGLLVDDDPLFLRALQRSLQRHGLRTSLARSCADALAAAQAEPPAFAVIDLKLEGASGLDLIEPLKSIRADMRILVLTGYSSIATAVEAIKRGADNYLPKPASGMAILRALQGETAAEPAPPASMTPLSRLEWEHIQQALTETDGNISAAARLLGMHRRSLQRKLAKRPGPERSRQ